MKHTEKYYSIIITFPCAFLLDLAHSLPEDEDDSPFLEKSDYILKGFKECIRQIEAVRTHADDMVWYHSIGNRPTQEILWCYISILGKIRYKAKVVEWQPGHEKQFGDGRKMSAKHWLVLCDFVPAPHDIERKGFQGFRYTHELF